MKPDEQRAYDHSRWADRYNRKNQPKKAAAHIRRAVQLQRGAWFGEPEKVLVLLDRIYGSVISSYYTPVYSATVYGRPRCVQGHV